jgi:hypothetical protein
MQREPELDEMLKRNFSRLQLWNSLQNCKFESLLSYALIRRCVVYTSCVIKTVH